MRDKPDFYRQVGERIRKERLARKVSQEALAMTVGLKRTSISNIEKGRQKLLLHTFYEIAETLKAQPTVLLPSPAEPQPIPATATRTLQMLSQEERAFVVSAAGLKDSTAFPSPKRRG